MQIINASTNLKRVSPGYVIRRLLQSGHAAWRIVNTVPLIQLSLASLCNWSTDDCTETKENIHGDFLIEKKLQNRRETRSSVLNAAITNRQEKEKNRSDSQRVLRTDVFYRSVEAIRMCEPGGQLADDSTADEHLRRAGRPYAIWWALACFPSAAAVCSDQPLAAAAAFTLDRKDARRKDARRATRHYLESRLFSQSRTESHRIADGRSLAGDRYLGR